MVVAGAAQIGVIEQGRRPVFPGGRRGFAREQRDDAFAIERADLERAGGDGFGARGLHASIKLQNAEAGAKALFGMAPTRTATINPSVFGPMLAAQRRKRSGVQSA